MILKKKNHFIEIEKDFLLNQKYFQFDYYFALFQTLKNRKNNVQKRFYVKINEA